MPEKFGCDIFITDNYYGRLHGDRKPGIITRLGYDFIPSPFNLLSFWGRLAPFFIDT